MGHIKIEELRAFVSVPVEVAITDEKGSENAPFVKKIIKQVKLCPDQTHIRIYFDSIKFLAIPITAEVTQNEDDWSAYDLESALRYTIRKV
ncbi:hypothetical protein HHO41_16950 [Bacillus sp. DNRA2]|uniref:hypothetical protein n=1 Tax=Bacillus sp. DNRA2 TaxID=2723053 RepID=UPI00145C6B22|nr:hypothetical protein [Bacillus sp. DNRA2]